MSNSGRRPKLRIARTKSEIIWDIIGYTFYLGSIVFLIFSWNALPDKVPAHFNMAGEVDRWGPKIELIILPIIGGFVAGLMHWFEKYPEIHNYPERLNEVNAREFYLSSRKTMNQLKNICFIFFALSLVESMIIAKGLENPFGNWLLPVLLASMAIAIVIGLIKQRKIR